ncbi:hypothetical protein HY212_02655 [Candidatus Pacearchaeota archaeon]|nr:hypothetical protein [Candidatus Pacearchaeota archaeon]
MKEYEDPNIEVARRLYNGSSLLRALGSVRRFPERIREEQKHLVADYFIDQIKQNGIDAHFIPEEEILRMTGDPKNLATLKQRKLYISDKMQKPENFLILMDELAHEVGFLLTKINYGSRPEIPIVKPWDIWAPHLLDRMPWYEKAA